MSTFTEILILLPAQKVFKVFFFFEDPQYITYVLKQINAQINNTMITILLVNFVATHNYFARKFQKALSYL